MSYEDKTVLELREKVWDSCLVSSRWMLTYLRKDEAIVLLESDEPASEDFVMELRARQEKHMSKALKARKSRAEKFGISNLSHEERVKKVIEMHGPLEFLESRSYEEGFESATGSRRGKHAIVFLSSAGDEILMTKGEARLASILGVSVPFSAFSSAKGSENKTIGRKTAKDIFGE